MEWVEGVLDPNLKIRLISDEEAARNRAWREAQRALKSGRS
jgi:hypothetical protein